MKRVKIHVRTLKIENYKFENTKQLSKPNESGGETRAVQKVSMSEDNSVINLQKQPNLMKKKLKSYMYF